MIAKFINFVNRHKQFVTQLDHEMKNAQNPYLAARLEWNYLFSDLIKAKQYWRWWAFGLLLTNIILLSGLIKVSSKSQIVPYVVKVDQLGNSVYGGFLDQKKTITAAEVNTFLRHYIINAKSILMDPFAQKSNTEFVYGVSLPAARKVLDEHYRGHNPFQVAKEEIIEVQVKGVIQKSKKTWQVDWLEIHRSHEGHILSQKYWEALITITQHDIKNPEILNTNPLGIFIEQMNWAEQV